MKYFFNISRSKGNQTMKLGQLIEYKEKILLQKLCEKLGNLFLFLKKA